MHSRLPFQCQFWRGPTPSGSWLLASWLAGWLAGWLLPGCWLAAGWLQNVKMRAIFCTFFGRMATPTKKQTSRILIFSTNSVSTPHFVCLLVSLELQIISHFPKSSKNLKSQPHISRSLSQDRVPPLHQPRPCWGWSVGTELQAPTPRMSEPRAKSTKGIKSV